MLGNTEITHIMVHNRVYAYPSAVQSMDIVNTSSDIHIVRPRQPKVMDRGRNTTVLVRKRPKMGPKHEKTTLRTHSKGYTRSEKASHRSSEMVTFLFQQGEA